MRSSKGLSLDSVQQRSEEQNIRVFYHDRVSLSFFFGAEHLGSLLEQEVAEHHGALPGQGSTAFGAAEHPFFYHDRVPQCLLEQNITVLPATGFNSAWTSSFSFVAILAQVSIMAVSDHVFQRFPFDLLFQVSATQHSNAICFHS